MKYTMPITLQGPDSIAAAQALREDRAKKYHWPFPWCFPPPGAKRVTAGTDASGTLIVPTVLAGATQGLAYTVDEGFQFALQAIVIEYLNAGVLGRYQSGRLPLVLDFESAGGRDDVPRFACAGLYECRYSVGHASDSLAFGMRGTVPAE